MISITRFQYLPGKVVMKMILICSRKNNDFTVKNLVKSH